MRGGGLLGFELIGQDEVGVAEEVLVDWDDVRGDVDLAIVTHDGVEDWSVSAAVGRPAPAVASPVPYPRRMCQA